MTPGTPGTHLIRGCSLDSETGGLVLEYLTPATDVRSNGLVLNHALLIPPEDAYLALLEQVELVLQRTLSTALAMFADAAPIDLAPEGAPAFDNPEER